jgi:hypothetical protein
METKQQNVLYAHVDKSCECISSSAQYVTVQKNISHIQV